MQIVTLLVTEDEMIGWHQQPDACESEQTPGDDRSEGQEAWRAAVHAVAESGRTEQLNKSKMCSHETRAYT